MQRQQGSDRRTGECESRYVRRMSPLLFRLVLQSVQGMVNVAEVQEEPVMEMDRSWPRQRKDWPSIHRSRGSGREKTMMSMEEAGVTRQRLGSGKRN